MLLGKDSLESVGISGTELLSDALGSAINEDGLKIFRVTSGVGLGREKGFQLVGRSSSCLSLGTTSAGLSTHEVGEERTRLRRRLGKCAGARLLYSSSPHYSLC